MDLTCGSCILATDSWRVANYELRVPNSLEGEASVIRLLEEVCVWVCQGLPSLEPERLVDGMQENGEKVAVSDEYGQRSILRQDVVQG